MPFFVGMNRKKILLFLALAFGIAWSSAAAMYLLDIEYGSPISMMVIAVAYMGAPAWATLIVQKGIYRGSVKQYGWSLQGKRSIKTALWAALFGCLLVPGTLLVCAVLGNGLAIKGFGMVSMSEAGILENLSNALPDQRSDGMAKLIEEGFPFPIWSLLPISLLAGVFSAATFNLPFMFGEEFGWRGLLLYEWRKLGLWKNTIAIGVVWGVWHAPIILMGHNYPGHPYLGILMMCLLTTSMCIPFAWLRVRGGSILAPCILHGVINGTAGASVIYLANGSEMLGSVVGIAGILVLLFTSMGILLFDRNFFQEFARN